MYFNSLPHTEVDRAVSEQTDFAKYFNSLPHTEVDGVSAVDEIDCAAFQLTTSHRGRRNAREESGDNYQHFNSLPHTEVDKDYYFRNPGQRNFNSLPHTEVDIIDAGNRKIPNISTHYLTQR